MVTTSQPPIELSTLECHPGQVDINVNSLPDQTFPSQTATLPPTDHGFAAWRLLLSAFVFESLLWGFPLSFGVFQSYYSSVPSFGDSAYISVIGTTASGISYLGAPVVAPLIKRWGKYRTHMIYVGWPICILSLVAGSFCTTLCGLVVTQGVGYGLGFVVFYYPILSFVDEFWIKRRGMAYGFLCSASGVSGAVTPIIMQICLRKYGYQWTLRGVASVLVLTTGPLIPFLKGRGGHANDSVRLRSDWSFLRNSTFWWYMVSNLAMGMGYFFPSVYLPSYATELGFSEQNGALLITLMSVAQVFGQFAFGYVSDLKVLSVDGLLGIASLTAAFTTLTLWGLAKSMVTLSFFAVLYGFFGAGYTAMWARMVSSVSEEPSASQAIFGLFCFGKGIGNVLTGPMSAGLLAHGRSSGYGGGMYKVVVVFTGVCMLSSAGTLGLGWIMRTMKGLRTGL